MTKGLLLLVLSLGLALLCFRQAFKIQERWAINGEVRDPIHYYLIRVLVMPGGSIIIVALVYIYGMFDPSLDLIGRNDPNVRNR
jgi:uncharacterized membrane protein YdjX (TVP38/TMEM64 family)